MTRLLITAALITSLAAGIRADTGDQKETGIVGKVIRLSSIERTDRWAGPCSGWRYGEFKSTPIRNRRLARCVFERVVPTEVSTALYVGDRESHFDEMADNGSCGGIFQHKHRYWAARALAVKARAWWRRWFTPWTGDIYDARLNVLTTALMVRWGGWGPWQ